MLHVRMLSEDDVACLALRLMRSFPAAQCLAPRVLTRKEEDELRRKCSGGAARVL